MNTDTIRSILNIVFMVLAVASIILYFTSNFTVFIYVCGAAIAVKLIEFFVRFML